jgi:putative thiamine transport system permease protein
MISRFIIILICLLPIIAGLAGAILPASGWFAPLGRYDFSLEPVFMFLDQPGIWTSIWLSGFTALIATFISYVLAMVLLARLYHNGRAGFIFRLIAPLLAVPHITVAVGFLFLLQPSGWLIRLLSPWLTGWERPPDLYLIPDGYGVGLILALIAKELPFLLLMGVSALSQIRVSDHMDHAASLGYRPYSAWLYTITPQLAKRMRLPVMIVLMFSVSVVDMALILAPSLPAPLAPRILDWFYDADLNHQFIAAVGAVVQLGLALICCVIWISCAYATGQFIRYLTYHGRRGYLPSVLVKGSKHSLFIIAILPCLISVMGLISVIIWGFANIWRFPAVFPDQWGVRAWINTADVMFVAGFNSVMIAGISALASIIIAIIWFEQTATRDHSHMEKWVYLPLLLPQASFLFGLQVLLIWFRLDGLYITLIWVHMLFVFPYVMLTLGPTWRRFDCRYTNIAATLGAGKIKRLFRIKLPILLTPIMTAFAIGFSVSCALYLPTIFASNGRMVTLTTEAVTLASGASRQALGVASILQMILPLVVFLLCDAVIRWRFGRFRHFRS